MSAALTLEMDESVIAQVDALAAARGETRGEIVRDALEAFLAEIQDMHHDGQPLLDWQLALIEEGLAAAERGDFASDEEVKAVFNRYRL